MPGAVVSLLRRLALRSSKITDFSTNLRTLSICSDPLIGARMVQLKPDVKQVSSSSPKQVPQIGKTFPRLFSAIANSRMKLAFLTQWLSIWIQSSPAPPVKSTPLTFLRMASMSDWLEKAQMGTTWAPDIQTYFTQAAEMQVLSHSLVEGSSYQSIWVQMPMTGV